MGEPIKLYDKAGNPHTFSAPSEAHAQVVAGLMFEQPPAQPVASDVVYATALVVGPDGTQEVYAVPVAPMPKRARKGDKGGGVL